jgi:integrase
MKKSSKSNSVAGAANPLTNTVQTVPGMPTKLKIFKVASSRYWWVRIYLDGRYRMSTLKTEKLREAQEAAKKFFYQALLDAEQGNDRSKGRILSRSFISVGAKFIESQNVPDKVRRYNDDRIRFNKELVPYFAEKDVGEITNADIGALAKQMQQQGKSPATVNQYLIVLRKILKYAVDNRLIQAIPNFPKVKGKGAMTKRDYFEFKEYETLIQTIEDMAADGTRVRGVLVTLEFKYLVQFMVNSFIRPSDLRVMRHEHVHVMINQAVKKAGDKKYLLLKHPATKTTDQEVVTMPAAHGIYQDLRAMQEMRGFGRAKDFVFFPEYDNRSTMIAVAGRIFSAVIKRGQLVQEGEKHTLYSLRHTSIMYRLLLGETSTLELARNARTSQAMIDKHYASRLTPLMAVDSIHSFKAAPAPAKKKVSSKKGSK